MYLLDLLLLLIPAMAQHLPPVGTQVPLDTLDTSHTSHTTYCSPSLGSMDGEVVVEQEDGRFLNLTNVSWQLGLGSALCYKFRSEQEARGRMEVSYVSLKTLYSVLDTFTFPLVSSSVSCVCDCPGGPSHCQAGKDNC